MQTIKGSPKLTLIDPDYEGRLRWLLSCQRPRMSWRNLLSPNPTLCFLAILNVSTDTSIPKLLMESIVFPKLRVIRTFTIDVSSPTFSTRSDFEDRDRHPHFMREFDDDQSQEARRIFLSRFPRPRRTQSIPLTRRTDSHSTTQRYNEDYSNVQVWRSSKSGKSLSVRENEYWLLVGGALWLLWEIIFLVTRHASRDSPLKMCLWVNSSVVVHFHCLVLSSRCRVDAHEHFRGLWREILITSGLTKVHLEKY